MSLTDNNKWSKRMSARLTGLLGLLVLISGSYAHSVNTNLIIINNVGETIQNLTQQGGLYRIGFVSGLLMETIFVFYAFMLYYILKSTNEKVAMLMLILALVPAPIFFLNQLNHFAAFLAAQANDSDAMLMSLNLHKHGGLIISIFFGLWLFPLGYLAFKSSHIHKLIGVLLMIGGLGYLINFVQGFLFPGAESTLWSNPALVVTHLSEISLVLWLLIRGVKSL